MKETVIINVTNKGWYDIKPLINFFSNAKDGDYIVEIKRLRKQRTLDQNGWLWGCIYELLLNALIAEGWEFTSKEEVHEYFKDMYCKQRKVNKFTGEVVEFPASTTEMDTVTFSEYCEQLRSYGKFLGIDIPDPCKDWREQNNG